MSENTTSSPANDQITTIVVIVLILLVLGFLSAYAIWSYPRDDILQNSVNISTEVKHSEEKHTKDDVNDGSEEKSHRRKHKRRHRR